MNGDIELHDTVKKISGSPLEMEVVQVTKDSIICQWVEDGETEQAVL